MANLLSHFPRKKGLNFVTKNFIRDRRGTSKNFSDKDFAELPGELSGAICLTTLVLLGTAIELFRKVFGTVRASCSALGFFFGP